MNLTDKCKKCGHEMGAHNGKKCPPEPPPATVKELLQEQVDVILQTLGTDLTFVEWYHDGCAIEALSWAVGPSITSAVFAFGYLRGAHEMADVTMLELLDAHGVNYGGAS